MVSGRQTTGFWRKRQFVAHLGCRQEHPTLHTRESPGADRPSSHSMCACFILIRNILLDVFTQVSGFCVFWQLVNPSHSLAIVHHTQRSMCVQAAVKALAWSPFQRNLLASGGGTADRQIMYWNSSTGTLLNSVDTKSQVKPRHLSQHCVVFVALLYLASSLSTRSL